MTGQRELRNDGPEPAELCDHCTHPWTEHHVELGCTRGWFNKARPWVIPTDDMSVACYCRLAHTGVMSA
jgi:hypothetical protein